MWMKRLEKDFQLVVGAAMGAVLVVVGSRNSPSLYHIRR
jgi:hypothetical protein